MNAENFAYWLQGFFELADTDDLTKEQVQMIKDHLAIVFMKITPDQKQKKFKKKGKKVLSELADALPTIKSPSVFPGSNIDEIRRYIEESVRKKQQEDEKRFIVTCDATPTSQELMDTVKKSAQKSRERIYPSPTRWIGGGRGQKYC